MNSLGVQSDSKQVSRVQGTPVLSGVVQSRGVQAYPELLLLLDQPARGLAHLFPMAMGDQVLVTIEYGVLGTRLLHAYGKLIHPQSVSNNL
ncbi:MAG: hypothetical protein ACHRXM_01830 [Isosphaerales bacterium]